MKWIDVNPRQLKATKVKPNPPFQFGRSQLVPCGKCGFCLANKRMNWVFRIKQEMKAQLQPGYFLTLTYDEKHVPRTQENEHTLRFRHVQLYLKRLRKAGYYCKYVCVGEYGTKTKRPHYHMLLWSDAPVEFLESNWKNRKNELLGFIHFGTLTVESAMYSMKYIIQPKVSYGKREKPRAQFSKGIGLSFLTRKMYDYLTENYDEPLFTVKVDEQTFALPRYYRNKIFTRHQLKVEGQRVKELRDKEYRKTIDRYYDQGIVNPEKYLKNLRSEKSSKIFKDSKVNELL